MYLLLQDNPAAVGMALSEPLGGGLFTSNVVLGAVVLLSNKSRKVRCIYSPCGRAGRFFREF